MGFLLSCYWVFSFSWRKLNQDPGPADATMGQEGCPVGLPGRCSMLRRLCVGVTSLMPQQTRRGAQGGSGCLDGKEHPNQEEGCSGTVPGPDPGLLCHPHAHTQARAGRLSGKS